MFAKRCPHCLQKIQFKKWFAKKCPHCDRTLRRASDINDRTEFGAYFEDRSASFWFLWLLILLALTAITMQIAGNADLLTLMDHHPFWFVVAVWWLSIFGALIGRMYVPLLLGAPKIMRRERKTISYYKTLTTVGLILGLPFAMMFVGWRNLFYAFPGVAFLVTVPVSLMWSYMALTLTDDDYEDERTWSYLSELGAQDRLEHRHHAYMVLVGLPIAGLIFYYFLVHPWLYWAVKNSAIIAMIKELYFRATGKMI